MATIHISVAVLHTPAPGRRSVEECIALLPEDSPATIDEDFARDVEEAVAARRESLSARIATGNPRHFQIVPGLEIVPF